MWTWNCDKHEKVSSSLRTYTGGSDPAKEFREGWHDEGQTEQRLQG